MVISRGLPGNWENLTQPISGYQELRLLPQSFWPKEKLQFLALFKKASRDRTTGEEIVPEREQFSPNTSPLKVQSQSKAVKQTEERLP